MEPQSTPVAETPTSLGDAQLAALSTAVLSRAPLYEQILKTTGIKIELGEETCFDHDREVLILGMEQLRGMGLATVDALDYATLHEGFHLMELIEDVKGYVKSIHAHEDDPLRNIIFRLHNCTQDVYVNSRIKNEAAQYRSGDDHAPLVKSFYTEHLFPDVDLSSAPLAAQFCDRLLLAGMGCAARYTFSPRINEIFEAGLKGLSGTQVSFEEFITHHFTASAAAVLPDAERVGVRALVTDRKLLPILRMLAEEDLASGRGGDLKNLTPQVGGIFGRLPKADIEKLAKKVSARVNETPAQRQQREQRDQIKKAGAEHGLSPEKVDEFARVAAAARTEIPKLLEAWNKLRFVDTRVTTTEEGPLLRGTELMIPEIIAQIGTVLESPSAARLYSRRVAHESVEIHPRKLSVKLLVDCSGSMKQSLFEVEKTIVALGGSLQSRNLEAINNGEPLSCSLQIIGFSGSATELLPYTESINVGHQMKAYAGIYADGGTSDHFALEKTHQSITAELAAIDGEKDVIHVVIEVTDGETSDKRSSIGWIRKIEELGALAMAIRIDSAVNDKGEEITELPASDTFGEIWGRRGVRIPNSSRLGDAIYRHIDRAAVGFSEKRSSGELLNK